MTTLNAAEWQALLTDLDRSPRQVQLHRADLESPTAWCMDEIFELTEPGEDQQRKMELFVLAYNLGNFLRRLALPRSVKHWSSTTLREKLIKMGAKVVRHAKYVTFQTDEVAVPRELFARILERIQWFGVPPPVARKR